MLATRRLLRISQHLRPAAALRRLGDGGGMKDEYGELTSAGEAYFAGKFQLENGQWLDNPEVRYNCYGELNEAKDNVLVVCHALTGNSQVANWWGSLLGPGKAFDTDKYYVVCANILGSCYGTTGPLSRDPTTGSQYLIDFPKVSVRDTVNLHLKMMREGIGANQVAAVVGGSLGGMQTLEWALCGGDYVKSIVPIACGAAHTAWQIGTSECQRQAIYADPKWCNGRFDPNDPPLQGLAVARQMAMVSYRTAKAFQKKFGRETKDGSMFQVRSYLEYQGEKFKTRMDPLSYLCITEQMDTHDVGRHRGGIDAALASIAQPTLVLGVDSDVLYPLHEQEELAAKIPGAQFQIVNSNEGHDGFLLEQDQIQAAVKSFLNSLDER
mmetsp:Transcript_45357/g.142231  ORF Transcript_45357/g.142231 Transcript_45357/m.142231 type:complete len:382 (-) Transcript_45357:201-1346(-)